MKPGGFRGFDRLSGACAPQLCVGRGRAMMIVYDEQSLEGYMKNAVEASPGKAGAD